MALPTSQQILGLVKAIDATGLKGRVHAVRRFGGVTRMTAPTLAQFLDDLDRIAGDRPVPEQYTHPREVAVVRRQMQPTQDGHEPVPTHLSPSDLAWLSRLDTSDPSAVPFDDAVQVFSLLASVKAPDEKRLVESLARPLDRWHSEGQALAELRNARLALPPIPESATPVLANALGRELDQLSPSECASRAADTISALAAERTSARAAREQAASERLAQIKAEADAAAAPTRTS